MKSLFFIFLLLILTLPSVMSLFKPGLPPTHDGEYHVIRAYEFDKTLRDGDWYPRWLPDLNSGYGTPLMNYYYPLPYYAMSFLHFLGIGFIEAFKTSMISASLIGAIFMFLWARRFWGNFGGLVGSIFYTYSPYHFLDIYIRGSLGEVWALGFFPAFLWSITKFVEEKNRLFIPVSSLFLSLIIFSHNILALMFFPFTISYTLFLIRRAADKKKRHLTFFSCSIFLLSLGLSSIFWAPAIFERGYVVGLEIYNYKSHFVELYQLIFPSWGSGFSADSATEGLSFQIGVTNITTLILSVGLLLLKIRGKKENFGINVFFILWSFLTIVLMLNVSGFIWEHIPFMKYFQFPWRFLSLVILTCSFLAASLVAVGKGLKTKVLSLFLILLPLPLGIGYANSAYHHLRDDNYYISRSNFIDGTNTPGDVFNTIWFNKKLSREKEKFTIREGDALVTIHSLRSTKYEASIVTNENVTVQANTAYFPGWQAFIDRERVETRSNKDGLIEFLMPKGKHDFTVKLTNTPVRIVAIYISFISFFIILTFFINILYTNLRKK